VYHERLDSAAWECAVGDGLQRPTRCAVLSFAALQTYASLHHIKDARWHLLTGPRADIERLARDSYFVNLNDGTSYGVSNLAHTETLVLVDGQGRLRGMYTGSLPLDIARLSEDIRSVLKEAQ